LARGGAFFSLGSGCALIRQPVGKVAVNPLIGWLYQKINRRSGVLAATLLAVGTTAAYGLLQGLWPLLAARCLWGVAWTLLRLGAYFTILEYANDNNRGHFMGTYNGLFRLGSLVGMLLGGLLADMFGLKTVSLVFAAISACSLPCVFLFIPNTRFYEQPKPATGWSTLKTLRQRPVVRAMLTGLIIAMIYQGVFNSTLSHLIKSLYSEALVLGSLVIGAASLAGVIQAVRWCWEPWLTPWFGKRSDKGSGRASLLTATLLLATVLFAIIPVKLPISFCLCLLLALQATATILTTLADAVASDAAAATSKSIMTAYSFITDLGAALGPLAGYLINQALDVEYTYWFAALSLGLLAVKWLTASK